MGHICKKLLYTLKTESINLFNKLLGFPSDADWSNIIEMCIVVSNFTGTNRKCQEDSFVKWEHFVWFFFFFFGVKRYLQGQRGCISITPICNNCRLPRISFSITVLGCSLHLIHAWDIIVMELTLEQSAARTILTELGKSTDFCEQKSPKCRIPPYPSHFKLGKLKENIIK